MPFYLNFGLPGPFSFSTRLGRTKPKPPLETSAKVVGGIGGTLTMAYLAVANWGFVGWLLIGGVVLAAIGILLWLVSITPDIGPEPVGGVRDRQRQEDIDRFIAGSS